MNPVFHQVMLLLVFICSFFLVSKMRRRMGLSLMNYEPTRVDFRKVQNRYQAFSLLINLFLPAFLFAVYLLQDLFSFYGVFGKGVTHRMLLMSLLFPSYLLLSSLDTYLLFKTINPPANKVSHKELIFSLVLNLCFPLITLIVSVFICGILTVNYVSAYWLFGGLVAIILAGNFMKGERQKAGGVKLGKAIPLEESPLKSEIDFIANRCELNKFELLIQTQIKGDDVVDRKNGFVNSGMRLRGWVEVFNAEKPLLPIELLQSTDPDALTAGLASMIMRFQSRKKTILSNIKKRYLILPIVLFFFSPYLILLVHLFLFPINFSSTLYIILMPGLVVIFAFLVVIFLFTEFFYKKRRRKQVLYIAAQAWIDAAPDENRSAFDFMRATFDFNCAINPEIEEKNIAKMLLGLDNIDYFLKKNVRSEDEKIIRDFLRSKVV